MAFIRGSFRGFWAAGRELISNDCLEAGDEDTDAADDEVAGGAAWFDLDQLDGKGESVGPEDEAIGLITCVTKDEVAPEAYGVDVEARRRVVLDQSGVVAVEDGDAVGGQGGLHGKGLSGSDADRHEALPVAWADGLPEAKIVEAAGGELDAVEGGGGGDEGIVHGAGRRDEWDELRRRRGGSEPGLRRGQQIFHAERESSHDSIHGLQAQAALAA